jgi:hypothetical protein
MQIQRLLNSPMGKVALSIILGFGLATLFRKVCTDKNCIVFNGPVISEEDIYKHDEKCLQYAMESTSCDNSKKTIDIEKRDDIKPKKTFFGIL